MPSSGSLPKVGAEAPSPPESLTTPRKGPMPEALRAEEAVCQEGCCGSSRSTGRVAAEERSTHFQSSLSSPVCPGATYTSSMELNNCESWIWRRLSTPGRTTT